MVVLKLSCRVEAEPQSIKLSRSVTFKSIGLSCTLNLFTHTWLRKCSFMELHKSAKYWHVLWYHLKKKTKQPFVGSAVSPSEESVSTEKAFVKVPGGRYNFSKNWISAWKLEFYCWQQTLQVFSLTRLAHWVQFEKMFTRYAALSSSYLYKNTTTPRGIEKVASSAYT